MNKRTLAIYPGSFNPFHQGHQNILEKAERIFGKDNVIVAIGVNPEKIDKDKQKLMSLYGIEKILEDIKEVRVKMLRQQLPSKQVEGYHGFLTEYVREKESEGYNVVVIRVLRNGHDFDYEYNQIRFMWDQMPMLNIMCLFADPAYMHVSSSAYRALEKVKPGAGHKYLAREVEDTSKVTVEMVEEQLSVVVVLDEETPQMLQKYDIVPFESAKEYAFKGTYAQCLDWIKEKEKNDEQKRK